METQQLELQDGNIQFCLIYTKDNQKMRQYYEDVTKATENRDELKLDGIDAKLYRIETEEIE